MRAVFSTVLTFLLVSCKAPIRQDLSPVATPNAEALVYRAFVRDHFEKDWKTSCPHAVLDSSALPIEARDPTQQFYLQPEKPPSELTKHLMNLANDHRAISAGSDPFYIPVDDRVLSVMFRQPCSVEDMQQLRCGWLQFKQLYGAACGTWRFSHVAFNTQQDEALFRYDLGVYHWAEGGWAYMRRRDGQWKLISVGVEFVS
jgi:hypothetical protein